MDNDLLSGMDKMWDFNIKSAVLSSKLAAKNLREGGLFVLTGAAAAIGPTPTMIAYGISKVATHQLIKSLASEGSGMPKNSNVVGILPITLDTKSNREGITKNQKKNITSKSKKKYIFMLFFFFF